MSRRLDDWVASYLKFAENTEPPISFHRWTAMSCIAAALQRKVFMDWGMERIYPNLYIVLLGPSAQTRKSTALRIGESMVETLGISTIGQDNSPEAVIRAVKESLLTVNDGTAVRLQSAVVCFSSELAVFLGRQNSAFHVYLTDWYDSPDQWTRTTKHQGTDDISGLCFNLLGAMAPDWIQHVFTPESIGGGFTSRITFIHEQRKAKTIANPNKFPIDEKLKDDLLHDLEAIHTMVGAYTLSDEAERFYEDWYIEEDRAIQEDHFPIDDPAFHTYCGRRGTLLRKVSMIVAASRSDDLIVQKQDISDALDYIEDAEKKMVGIFGGVGRSGNAFQTAAVKSMLRQHETIKKSTMLQALHNDMSVDDLDGIEKTLEASKLIKVKRLTEEADTEYTWLGKR